MVRAGPRRPSPPSTTSGRRTGSCPREVWLSGGAQGLLGMDVEEEYGGGGVRDFRYNAVLDEEMTRIGASGVGFGLHNDVVGAVPARPGHRGAEAALAARLLPAAS